MTTMHRYYPPYRHVEEKLRHLHGTCTSIHVRLATAEEARFTGFIRQNPESREAGDFVGPCRKLLIASVQWILRLSSAPIGGIWMALGTGENTSTQSLMVYCCSSGEGERINYLSVRGSKPAWRLFLESCLRRKPEEVKTKDSAKICSAKDVWTTQQPKLSELICLAERPSAIFHDVRCPEAFVCVQGAP